LFVLLAVGLFVWFYPVLSGMPLSSFWFRARMWVNGWV
jgi:dolichyl-phosphate-mannose--protein O-mannosyl transferase